MNNVFVNSENSKTSDSRRILLNITDKTELRGKDKYVALSNLSIYYAWKNIKKSYNNNEFKITAGTWNEEFELPDGLYSISDIQDYFEYILKSMGQKQWIVEQEYTQIKQKTESRLKLKTVYYLELLTNETMKLLGSTKCKITKNANGENNPYLEITELALIHYNVVNNSFQQKSRVLYTFVPK